MLCLWALVYAGSLGAISQDVHVTSIFVQTSGWEQNERNVASKSSSSLTSCVDFSRLLNSSGIHLFLGKMRMILPPPPPLECFED